MHAYIMYPVYPIYIIISPQVTTSVDIQIKKNVNLFDPKTSGY
jgi:hypothetical protein